MIDPAESLAEALTEYEQHPSTAAVDRVVRTAWFAVADLRKCRAELQASLPMKGLVIAS